MRAADASKMPWTTTWPPGEPQIHGGGEDRVIDAQGGERAAEAANPGGVAGIVQDPGEDRFVAQARAVRSLVQESVVPLQAVKNAYDPQNVFALNQNIPPSPAEIRLQLMHE